MNFQSSLNAEMESSIMIGRQLNLQKARELALSKDLTGFQKEIKNQLSGIGDFTELNVFQQESLAKALGPEIRVNTVCPGFIGTGWFENRFGKETFDRIKKDQESITPLNKAGTPDDIADSAVFFCLEGAEHITGETLISDAGMHLNLPKG